MTGTNDPAGRMPVPPIPQGPRDHRRKPRRESKKGTRIVAPLDRAQIPPTYFKGSKDFQSRKVGWIPETNKSTTSAGCLSLLSPQRIQVRDMSSGAAKHRPISLHPANQTAEPLESQQRNNNYIITKSANKNHMVPPRAVP